MHVASRDKMLNEKLLPDGHKNQFGANMELPSFTDGVSIPVVALINPLSGNVQGAGDVRCSCPT